MSSSLHPYYLQQMGIPLWEPRLPSITSALNEAKLLILAEGSDYCEDERQKLLLRQMLFSIGLNENEIYLTSTAQVPHLQITNLSTKVILTLGNGAARFLPLSEELSAVPRVCSFSLEHLLIHGQDKKKAYRDWLGVKDLLQAP